MEFFNAAFVEPIQLMIDIPDLFLQTLWEGFVAGILYALWFNSTQPATTGTFYELYAIAAAVLGGCSLRGGEGSIIGVVIGMAVLRPAEFIILMFSHKMPQD